MRFALMIILCVACSFIWADQTPEAFLPLNGFLGKEELQSAEKILKKIEEEKTSQVLILNINSSAGDLVQVLELAKSIYVLKSLKKLKVIVYLNDNVVGPAAILPFLADELYSSLFVVWGDIPLGSEDVLPTNILRNRVRSLIDPQSSKASLFYLLADAMSDPSLQVVSQDHQWAINRDKETKLPLVSAAGQTLVVNQNQLKELGLINDVLTTNQFFEKFHQTVPKDTQPSNEQKIAPSTDLEERLKKFIQVNPDGPNSIGYLYIGDHESAISESTWLYVKKGLEYYKLHPPAFIILELDTPGGEVFAAQKISDALKEMDTQYNIPIVTFINNWAISAGAMLAYSTRFIMATKDGTMGAAEPVIMGAEGKMQSASEKVNSALRADFASRARFFDRDPSIAEAMVDKDVILVLRHGRIVKLDNESQIQRSGPHPDLMISAKGKLLTLNANEMLKYGVADQVLAPEKRKAISDEEKQEGHWPLSKMLLAQVPFFANMPQATVDAYRMDWKTRFFVFLATPLVSSLLLMGLIIGAYMEMNHPGLGLPGLIAASCLFLIILSSLSLEIANWLEVILLMTGLILILAEIFVFPTMGILLVMGGLLFMAGLLGMLLPELKSIDFEYDTHTVNAAGHYLLKRLAWVMGTLILSFGVIALLARYVLPSFSGFNRFVLAGHEQDASLGFHAGSEPGSLPQIGERGEVLAPLRPAGKVMINQRIYEAISTGGFIDQGEEIEVVRLEGSAVVVNRLQTNGNL